MTTLVIRNLGYEGLSIVRTVESVDGEQYLKHKTTIASELIETVNGKPFWIFDYMLMQGHDVARALELPSYALSFEEEGFTMEFAR